MKFMKWFIPIWVTVAVLTLALTNYWLWKSHIALVNELKSSNEINQKLVESFKEERKQYIKRNGG